MKILVNDCRQEHWPSLLHLLLLKLLPVVVHFPQRDNLREYFEFTSVLLDKVPEKHVANFIEADGNSLCAEIFGLVKAERVESMN